MSHNCLSEYKRQRKAEIAAASAGTPEGGEKARALAVLCGLTDKTQSTEYRKYLAEILPVEAVPVMDSLVAHNNNAAKASGQARTERMFDRPDAEFEAEAEVERSKAERLAGALSAALNDAKSIMGEGISDAARAAGGMAAGAAGAVFSPVSGFMSLVGEVIGETAGAFGEVLEETAEGLAGGVGIAAPDSRSGDMTAGDGGGGSDDGDSDDDELDDTDELDGVEADSDPVDSRDQSQHHSQDQDPVHGADDADDDHGSVDDPVADADDQDQASPGKPVTKPDNTVKHPQGTRVNHSGHVRGSVHRDDAGVRNQEGDRDRVEDVRAKEKVDQATSRLGGTDGGDQAASPSTRGSTRAQSPSPSRAPSTASAAMGRENRRSRTVNALSKLTDRELLDLIERLQSV